jgi:hypothetical protein
MGGIIIYISIATIILGLAGGGGYCFWFSTTFAADDPFKKYVAWASYVIWALCALVILTVLCCFGAIKLGIAIFKTTAQYVGANMHIFLLPILSTLCTIIWFACWLVTAVYVFSVGTPEPK